MKNPKVMIPALANGRQGWDTLQFVAIELACSITLRKAGRPSVIEERYRAQIEALLATRGKSETVGVS